MRSHINGNQVFALEGALELTQVPQNVHQRHAFQAWHARDAVHACTIFLSGFVSIENKGSKIKIPQQKVASSILVARSI
jgi:hypothetical protein